MVAVQRETTVYRYPAEWVEAVWREVGLGAGLGEDELASQLRELCARLARHLAGAWLDAVLVACGDGAASAAAGCGNPLGWLLELAGGGEAAVRAVLPAELRGESAAISLALAAAVCGADGPDASEVEADDSDAEGAEDADA